MTRIADRLEELGVTLPEPVAPVANYIPYTITGNLVFVSGQVSIGEDGLIKGKVGRELDIGAGVKAARACAINLISQLHTACGGDLNRVRRVVKLGGFVNCTDYFHDHPKVINGASDLMVEVFGESGRHARFAVGAPCLPLNAAVEIDGVFEIE